MKSMNISRAFILASALAIPALYAGSANAQLLQIGPCGTCVYGAPMPDTHWFVDATTDCYMCHAKAADPVLNTTTSTATDPVADTTTSTATTLTATEPVATTSAVTVTASGNSGDHRQDAGHSKAGDHRKNGKK